MSRRGSAQWTVGGINPCNQQPHTQPHPGPHSHPRYLLRIWEIHESAFGRNHVGTAASCLSLGNLCVINSDLAQAKQWFKSAIEIFDHVYGRCMQVTAATESQLGHVEAKLGRRRRALAHLSRAADYYLETAKVSAWKSHQHLQRPQRFPTAPNDSQRLPMASCARAHFTLYYLPRQRSRHAPRARLRTAARSRPCRLEATRRIGGG